MAPLLRPPDVAEVKGRVLGVLDPLELLIIGCELRVLVLVKRPLLVLLLLNEETLLPAPESKTVLVEKPGAVIISGTVEVIVLNIDVNIDVDVDVNVVVDSTGIVVVVVSITIERATVVMESVVDDAAAIVQCERNKWPSETSDTGCFS